MCVDDGTLHVAHLLTDILVDHFLIAAQLGSVVSADRLVIVRSLVFVERVRSEVKHTIIGRFVLKNLAVGGCLLLRSLAHATFYEHAVVEITLVDLPHINEAEHDDGTHSILGLYLLHAQQQQHSGAEHDDEECAPAVGGEYRDAYLLQIAEQRTQIFRRNLLHCLQL